MGASTPKKPSSRTLACVHLFLLPFVIHEGNLLQIHPFLSETQTNSFALTYLESKVFVMN